MKILLDNIETTVNVKDYESFHYLLLDIERSIETKGRVITSLKVDGISLDVVSNFSLEEIKILEVMSQSPIGILRETIHELDNYLDKFFLGIESIVNNFRSGDKITGINSLVDGINGLDWIFQILKKSEELLYLKEEEIFGIYENAEVVMIKLTNAIDCKNYEEITILLEFRLYHLLSNIKEFVPVLLGKTDVLSNTENFIN